MRKLKKRLTALCVGFGVMASSVMSISASAVDPHYDWGPRQWTPYTGGFDATPNYVSVYSMRWRQDSLDKFVNDQSYTDTWDYTLEFEFRPVTSDATGNVDPETIWKESDKKTLKANLNSNLPSAFPEFDENDVTIGCGRAANLSASKPYYGVLHLDPADNAPANQRYIFESEYGMRPLSGILPGILGDSLPISYEQYNLCNTYVGTGNNYSWGT